MGGALDAIGRTPLVRLTRLLSRNPVEIYAKLECLNPGGSLKDRSALAIIEDAMARGLIQTGTVVIESSSGNMGIGLAQVCQYFDLPLICVVDPRTTSNNIALLKAYGATVDLVGTPDRRSGDFLTARLARVQELRRLYPASFWPNQYANDKNAEAHRIGTMREIADEMSNNVDYIFCATSTCGTLRGCTELVRARGLKTTVVAVDAEGSVIAGPSAGERVIPGLGAGIVPDLFSPDLADHYLQVSTADCIRGCLLLLQREAILAGGSSGALVAAVRALRPGMTPNARVVLVVCDRGDRYLDTIYSQSWREQYIGRDGLAWPDENTEAASCVTL